MFLDMSTMSVYEPKVGHSYLPPPQGTLQDQQLGPVKAPIKSLLFPWVLVHTRMCAPISPSCGAPVVKFCQPSKLNVPGALLSPRPTGWRD